MAKESPAENLEEELTEYEKIRERNIKEIESAMVESGTIKKIKSLSHKIKNDKSRKKANNKIKRIKTASFKHCNENTKKRVLRKQVFNYDKENLDNNRPMHKHGHFASDERSANIQCNRKRIRSAPLSPGWESCTSDNGAFSRHGQEYQVIVGSGYNCITIRGKNFDIISRAKSAVEDCFRNLNIQDSNLGCADIVYRQDSAKRNLRTSQLPSEVLKSIQLVQKSISKLENLEELLNLHESRQCISHEDASDSVVSDVKNTKTPKLPLYGKPISGQLTPCTSQSTLDKSNGGICHPLSDIVITGSKKKQNKILPLLEEIAKNNKYQSNPDETEIEVTSANKENKLTPSSHPLTWAALTCERLYHFCVYVNEQNNKCVSGQNSTMCNMCGHPFLFRRWLTKHMANEHNMKLKFECNTCSYITQNISDFRQHMSSQHLGIKLQCDQCSYASKCMKHLVRHKKAVHDNIRAYRCFSCSFASKRKLQLDNHVKIHETNETVSPDVSFM